MGLYGSRDHLGFQHLTISIKNGVLVAKTYQKPMSLHQYINPTSVHPQHAYHLLEVLPEHLQKRLLECGNDILQKSKM